MKPVQDIIFSNPLVAILRGVKPHEILEVADVLIAAGFRVIEIPLNSPEPFDSIERLARYAPESVVVGAGTVLSAADVDRAAAAGAQLMLSPNMNVSVIEHTAGRGLFSMPGVATVSEAFTALGAGASALKVFPADVLGTATIKAWRSVLPAAAPLFAVGGVDAKNIPLFRAAGVGGAGLGSSLYVPGMALVALALRARALLDAWKDESPR